LVRWYILRIFRSGSYIKVIGQSQGQEQKADHISVTKYTRGWSAFRYKAILL